jgi:L-alanine-DL-glutamate epimerase-like enolase superfamily enzyme
MQGMLPIDKDGMITVPEGVGLGVDLDWDLIKRSCRSYKEARA